MSQNTMPGSSIIMPPTQTQAERDALHAEWLLSGRKLEIEWWNSSLGGWHTNDGGPVWSNDVVYRRKPASKKVPLGPEDFPPGTVVRDPEWAKHHWTSIAEVGRFNILDGSGGMWRYEGLQEDGWLYKTPAMKEWKKCEKEED